MIYVFQQYTDESHPNIAVAGVSLPAVIRRLEAYRQDPALWLGELYTGDPYYAKELSAMIMALAVLPPPPESPGVYDVPWPTDCEKRFGVQPYPKLGLLVLDVEPTLPLMEGHKNVHMLRYCPPATEANLHPAPEHFTAVDFDAFKREKIKENPEYRKGSWFIRTAGTGISPTGWARI